jgi:hypothetical protein
MHHGASCDIMGEKNLVYIYIYTFFYLQYNIYDFYGWRKWFRIPMY